MKLITAIVKPEKLTHLRNVLQKAGVAGMTISEVMGFGRQKGHTEIYRGAEYQVDLIPKTKIEIAVNDIDYEKILQAILDGVGTKRIGDGKIFVTQLERVIRISSQEQDEDAI